MHSSAHDRPARAMRHARRAQRQQIDAGSHHDGVAFEGESEKREKRRENNAAQNRRDQTNPAAAATIRSRRATPRTRQHHAFEADIQNAGALAD